MIHYIDLLYLDLSFYFLDSQSSNKTIHLNNCLLQNKSTYWLWQTQNCDVIYSEHFTGTIKRTYGISKGIRSG